MQPTCPPVRSNTLCAIDVNAKAFQIALFGFINSAPLGHLLVKAMHSLCRTHRTICEAGVPDRVYESLGIASQRPI